jgi:hypothetical protein
MQNRFASSSCSCAINMKVITLRHNHTLSFNWRFHLRVPEENMLKEGLPNRQYREYSYNVQVPVFLRH